MTTPLTKYLLLFVALSQFLPIVGVAGVTMLKSLYAIDIDDPNLEVLLRHRAVLFGILGAIIALAAFRPTLQPLAIGIAATMIASFLALWASAPSMNAALDQLAAIDIGALLALVTAALTRRRALQKPRTHGASAGATR